MSANEKQVGGTHYKVEGEYQHWDVVIAMKWDYLIGNATKYLWRLGKKGDKAKAIEDARKAIHYIEKKIEVMETELALEQAGPVAPTFKFVSKHVNVEGSRMNGDNFYGCVHCSTRFWGDDRDVMEHMTKHHPELLK